MEGNVGIVERGGEERKQKRGEGKHQKKKRK